MPQPLSATVSLLLHTVSLLLYGASLLPIPRCSFTHANIDFVFSLYNCMDCEAEFDHVAPGCFENIYCSQFTRSGFCTLGVKLQYAADVSFYSTSLALLLLVLNLERLASLARRRDYGHPLIMLILIPLPPLCGAVGLTTWLVLVQPDFNADCGTSETTQEPCVQMEIGAILSILALATTLAASTSLAVAFCKRDKSLDGGIVGIGEGSVLAFSFRSWLLGKVAPILCIGLAFLVVSLSLPWVNFEDGQDFYRGDLTQLRDELPGHREIRYECLWGPACVNTTLAENEMMCNAFQRISTGSSLFIGIEALAILCLILWLEGLFYFSLRREFSFPVLESLWAPLACGFHTLALMSWFIYVNVRMGGDCEIAPDDTNITFCVDNGASFTIWQALCLFFAASLFEVLYCKRRSGSKVCDGLEFSKQVVNTEGDGLESPVKPRKIVDEEMETPAKLDTTVCEVVDNPYKEEIEMMHVAVETPPIASPPKTSQSMRTASPIRQLTLEKSSKPSTAHSRNAVVPMPESIEEIKEPLEAEGESLDAPMEEHICAKCRERADTNIVVLRCGHLIHNKCLKIVKRGLRRCPECYHTVY